MLSCCWRNASSDRPVHPEKRNNVHLIPGDLDIDGYVLAQRRQLGYVNFREEGSAVPSIAGSAMRPAFPLDVTPSLCVDDAFQARRVVVTGASCDGRGTIAITSELEV